MVAQGVPNQGGGNAVLDAFAISVAAAAPAKGYARVPGNSAKPAVERMLKAQRKGQPRAKRLTGNANLLRPVDSEPGPLGMLIVGASGTGKTELLKAIMEEHGADYTITVIEGTQLEGPCGGDCAKLIDAPWAALSTKSVQDKKPGLLLIDGLDQSDPQVQRRLAELMDGISSRGDIKVIATASAADGIAGKLRRPGIFDSEHVIKALDEGARQEIIAHLVGEYQVDAKLDLGVIAKATSGANASDLKGLVARATDWALARAEAANLAPEATKLTKDDFAFVYDDFSPSGLRGMSMKVAKVTFSDVGGLTLAKKELTENVIGPLRDPAKYAGFIKRPVKGVILKGPPGTGKTLLAEALANEAGVNFISIRASDIFRTSYVGDASRAIAELKQKVVAAKPVVVLIDEADGLLAARTSANSDGGQERMQAMNDFLQFMDGAGRESDGVVFVMTTNRADLIDSAVRRAGRTDLTIHVGLQGPKGRLKSLETLLRGRKLDSKVKLADLVAATARFTGAELELLCDTAGRHAANRGAKAIEVQDFSEALSKVLPQTPADEPEDDTGE